MASAAQQLRSHLRLYQAVFENLLPQELVAEIEPDVAWDEFFRNVAPTAADDWNIFERISAARRTGGESGLLTTGINELDDCLGGLHGVTLMGGDEGDGKTSLMLQMVNSSLLAHDDLAALVFSLDMSKHDIYERIYSLNFRTPVREMRAGSIVPRDAPAAQWQRILSRLQVRQREPYSKWVPCDYGQKNVPLGLQDVIFTYVNQLLGCTGTRRLIVAFDLFQRIDVGPNVQVSDRDAVRLDMFDMLKRDLERAFGPGNFAILATSEIRKSDRGQRTELITDDLKGDGRMGSDADNVLLIGRNRQRQTANTILPVTLRIWSNA